MQMIIDAIRLQISKGWVNNRINIRKIKSDAGALQEAAETIRSLIAECIERQLPIDEALAALHVATIKNIPLDAKAYQQIVEVSRTEQVSVIRQQRTAQHKNFLKQVEQRFDERLRKIQEDRK